MIADKDVEELARLHELAGLGPLDAPLKELIKANDNDAVQVILVVFKRIAAQIAEATFDEATAKIVRMKERVEKIRGRMEKLFPLMIPPQDGPLVDAEQKLLEMLGKIGPTAVILIAEEIKYEKAHPGLLLLVQKLAEIGHPAALPVLVHLAKEQQEAKNLAETKDHNLPILVLFAKNGEKKELEEIEELTVLPALVPFARKHYHKEIRDAVAKAIADIERKQYPQQQIDDRGCKEYLVRQNAPKEQKNGAQAQKKPNGGQIKGRLM